MKEKLKERLPLVILCLIFCGMTVFWGLRNKSNLQRNHQLTIGTIEDCENGGGRGNAGRIYLSYTFSVDGKNYNAQSTYFSTEISYFDGVKFFVGKKFPVMYYPQNPSNASILITPKNFTRWGYSFPDSLNWVLQYLPKP